MNRLDYNADIFEKRETTVRSTIWNMQMLPTNGCSTKKQVSIYHSNAMYDNRKEY